MSRMIGCSFIDMKGILFVLNGQEHTQIYFDLKPMVRKTMGFMPGMV